MEIKVAKKLLESHASWPGHSLHFIAWDPPPHSWIKVNYDGRVVASLEATYGGILRNDSSGFLGAYSTNLGICPIIIAEVWGA